jgi:D-amino-acid dehydrogenase
VELNALQAPVSETALDLAEKHAREALPLGKRLDANAWHGSRPTLPDSRPMIGACPDQPGLWLALGHQHIGFSTGPASGELLSCLMTGEVPFMDSAPFSPSRFQAGTG